LGDSGGNVHGRDAVVEPTGTYLRRFLEETADTSDDLVRCHIVTVFFVIFVCFVVKTVFLNGN
jgi:hypothetical protein